MTYLWVGFIAGLAATPHCVGMCGGFALHLARGPQGRLGVARTVAFLTGKMFTYVFLGALVGALGAWVVGAGWLPDARRTLVYGAAGLTILFGVLMLDVVPARWFARCASAALPSLLDAMAKPLESGIGCAMAHGAAILPTFILGLGVGFLPCPLTTALLMSAAGEQSVSAGMLLLGGAGLGTAPGLCLAGLLGSGASARWRSLGTRALGVVVIAIGVGVILRRSGVLPCG